MHRRLLGAESESESDSQSQVDRETETVFLGQSPVDEDAENTDVRRQAISKRNDVSKGVEELEKRRNSMIDTDLYTWGSCLHGELGLADEISYSQSKCVKTLPGIVTNTLGCNIIDIALGDCRTLALSQDGKILHWGRRFGKAIDEDHSTNPKMFIWDDINWNPSIISFPEQVKVEMVFCGYAHCAFLSNNQRSLWTMGLNNCGQLGIGNEISTSQPNVIKFYGLNIENGQREELVNFKIHSCSLGRFHSACIIEFGDQSRRVYSWGSNAKGALGNGIPMNSLIPTSISLFEDVRCEEISVGEFHSAFLTNTNQVYFCGFINERLICRFPRLIRFSAKSKIVSIKSGRGQTLALDEDGMVSCWPYHSSIVRNETLSSHSSHQIRCVIEKNISVSKMDMKGQQCIFLSSEDSIFTMNLDTEGNEHNLLEVKSPHTQLSVEKTIFSGLTHYALNVESSFSYKNEIAALFDSSEFSDTLILVGEVGIACHMFILLSRLPLFYQWIEQNAMLKEKDKTDFSHVELLNGTSSTQHSFSYIYRINPKTGVNVSILKYVLNFGYTGAIESFKDCFNIDDTEHLDYIFRNFGVRQIELSSSQSADLSIDLDLVAKNLEFLPDICLKIDNFCIFAHRAILYARSDFFKRMLLSGLMETFADSISFKEIDGFEINAFKNSILWLYTGTLDSRSFEMEDFYNLLVLSDCMGLSELKFKCEKLFFKFILSKSATEVNGSMLFVSLRFAQRYRAFRFQDLIFNSSLRAPLENAIKTYSLNQIIFFNNEYYSDNDQASRLDVETFLSIVYDIYTRSKEVRKATEDFKRNFLYRETNSEQVLKDEHFVVFEDDFRVMERPYLLLFATNIVTSVLCFLSAVIFFIRVDTLYAQNWFVTLLTLILALLISIVGRIFQSWHRSKFKINWWRKRQISKKILSLSSNMQSLSVLSERVQDLPKFDHDSYDATHLDPTGDQICSKVALLENVAGSTDQTLEDSDESISSELLSHHNYIPRIAQSLRNELRNTKNELYSIKQTAKAQQSLNFSVDFDILAQSIGSRVAFLVFLLLLSYYLDSTVTKAKSPPKLLIVWIPLIIFDFIYIIRVLRSTFALSRRLWHSSISRSQSFGIAIILVSLAVFLNFLALYFFSLDGILFGQNITMILKVTGITSLSWYVVFFPILIPSGTVSFFLLFIDFLFLVSAAIYLSFCHTRRYFKAFYARIKNKNPHLTIPIIFCSIIITHLLSFSLFSGVFLLALKLNDFPDLPYRTIFIPIFIFTASLTIQSIWMYRMRKFAWKSFRHVWKR